ncbi:hypothetical protein KUF71_002670, partial [Frankliniella fusca]
MMRDQLIEGTYDKKLKETLKDSPQLTLAEVEVMSANADSRRREQSEEAEGASTSVDSVQRGAKRSHAESSRGGITPKGPQASRGGRGAFRGHYTSSRGLPRGRGYGHGGPGGLRGGFYPPRGAFQPRGGPRGGYWGAGWVDPALAPYNCKKCASRHGPRKCPAWNKACNKCQGIGHFEKVCQYAKKPRLDSFTKFVETVQLAPSTNLLKVVKLPPSETHDISMDCDVLDIQPVIRDQFDFDEDGDISVTIDMLETATKEDAPVEALREYCETLKIRGKHFVNFKLDTGAQAYLIPYKVFCKLNSEGEISLKPSNLVLEAFNKTTTRAEGSFTGLTETRYGASMTLLFEVAKDIRRPILDITACHYLNLVRRVEHPKVESLVTKQVLVGETKESFLSKNRDVFEGLGQFKQTIHLDVDINIPSGMCPPRRYSYSIAERLKAKLSSLVATGVIDKVKGSLPKFISKDAAEHDQIMNKVLERARSENVKFNPDKIQFRQSEVKFLGLLWSHNAIKIDPTRTAAIQALKPPQSRLGLQKICGAFNHLRKFIPQMGAISAPLCDLLSSTVTFKWLPVHDEAFQKLKDCVKYLPGKLMYLADLLSRNFIEDPVEDDPEMVEVVHEVTSNLSFPAGWMDELKLETGRDVGLKSVMGYYQNGWPKSKEKPTPESMSYWKLQNDIFVEDEPLLPHPLPELRFQNISADILEFMSRPYLVVVDNFSRWLEIKPLSSKSSSSVIGALREIFCTHGIPEIIFGDNNPLDSFEWRQYAKSIGSTIVTSSPEYPRSNGLAEKAVHIAKQLLRKCHDSGSHYLDGLREYNNTPLTGMSVSPSQILLSRMVRTCVPTLSKALEPKVIDLGGVPQIMKLKVKEKHDRHARRKPVKFTVGQSIIYWRNRKWYKGTVVEKLNAPRSYLIRKLDGGILRRNTFHLQSSVTKPDKFDQPPVEKYHFNVPHSVLQMPERVIRGPQPLWEQPLDREMEDLGLQHLEGPGR